jgi:hypothetical protein
LNSQSYPFVIRDSRFVMAAAGLERPHHESRITNRE